MYSTESCSTTGQHRARCRYRGQCREEIDGLAGKKKTEKKLQNEDEGHCSEADVDDEMTREIERTESVTSELPSRKNIADIFKLCRSRATDKKQKSRAGSLKHFSASC